MQNQATIPLQGQSIRLFKRVYKYFCSLQLGKDPSTFDDHLTLYKLLSFRQWIQFCKQTNIIKMVASKQITKAFGVNKLSNGSLNFQGFKKGVRSLWEFAKISEEKKYEQDFEHFLREIGLDGKFLKEFNQPRGYAFGTIEQPNYQKSPAANKVRSKTLERNVDYKALRKRRQSQYKSAPKLPPINQPKLLVSWDQLNDQRVKRHIGWGKIKAVLIDQAQDRLLLKEHLMRGLKPVVVQRPAVRFKYSINDVLNPPVKELIRKV